MRNKFTEHPASVGETYLEHLGVALGFSARFAYGAFAAFVHAFLPFLFVKTGSALIKEMHDQMVTHRRRKPLNQSAHPSGAQPGAG